MNGNCQAHHIEDIRLDLQNCAPIDPDGRFGIYMDTVPTNDRHLVARVSDNVTATSGAAAVQNSADNEDSSSSFWHFMHELRQRKVCRAALLYAVTVWLICQIAELLFDALIFPEWALPLVIVVATLGFPIAMILAWTFEFTADGLVLDVPAVSSATDSGSRRVAKWNWALLVTGILISLQMLLHGIGAIETSTDNLARISNAETVVVTPFEAMNVSLETKAYAFVLSEEVRHLLHSEYELNVIYAESQSELTHQQRNADVLLQGRVSIAGGDVQVIVHLVDPRDGYDLWSEMIVIPDRGDAVSQHRAARAMLRALPFGGSGIPADTDSFVVRTTGRSNDSPDTRTDN